MSFADLYDTLSKYIDDPKRRFRLCVRAKRGLNDTKIHGGYYKDKVYFEGAVKILRNRKCIDVEWLFSGKISIDDLKRGEIQIKINKEDMKLPYFMQDKAKYERILDCIAVTNSID